VFVESLAVGPYRTNCYLLHDGMHVWIVDPGQEGLRLASILVQLGLTPKAVLLTHTHWDHVMGLPDLMTCYPDLPILVHPLDAYLLGPKGGGISLRFMRLLDPARADSCAEILQRLPAASGFLNDGDILEGCELKVLHTPGHTAGSISLYQSTERILFSGDTLFAGAIGRTDLPGSLPEAIIPSIVNKLLCLDARTKVLPGHGPSTTIARARHETDT
jgi:hydroxyacylglutathione hydrolase